MILIQFVGFNLNQIKKRNCTVVSSQILNMTIVNRRKGFFHKCDSVNMIGCVDQIIICLVFIWIKGLHNGGPAPFGFRVVDQKLVINDLEAFYVRKMFDAALNRRGFTDLIREMREAGIRGRNGSPIKYTQIYEILRNEKYAGIYVYSVEGCRHRKTRLETQDAIRLDGAIPAIVDKNTFFEVQKIMDDRKQTGKNPGTYLCSGLVYCQCGEKMHVCGAPDRKGGQYHYYYCKKHCGAPVVRVSQVDKAVKDYLAQLLSEPMQMKIAQFLRSYKDHRRDCRESFDAALQKQIAAKEQEYDTLMRNMSVMVLAPDILSDIHEKMKTIKEEIKVLENTTPPEEYSTDVILDWLKSIRTAPDSRAVHLLVKRIDVVSDNEKTDFNVVSTLESVSEKLVAAIGFEPMTGRV